MENPNFGGLMIYNACSFFGHRNASLTECERTKLIYVIEELIQGGVTKFLFGSRSDFDSLCHEIVHDFKQKYTEVKEMAFVCLSESVILESEKEEWEKIIHTSTKSLSTSNVLTKWCDIKQLSNLAERVMLRETKK